MIKLTGQRVKLYLGEFSCTVPVVTSSSSRRPQLAIAIKNLSPSLPVSARCCVWSINSQKHTFSGRDVFVGEGPEGSEDANRCCWAWSVGSAVVNAAESVQFLQHGIAINQSMKTNKVFYAFRHITYVPCLMAS